ncbi:MAG TPA: hypothetical protein VFV47_07970 [Hyphomicrobiaceae bacterium]|nr:hypothetical protein [Hyphomicrobiaceae bacterium]
MLRTTVLSAVAAIALPLALSASAMAAPDNAVRTKSAVTAAMRPAPAIIQVADASRPKQPTMAAKDAVLYDIISDQISEMRRKSALPATMCIAESNGDGTAETVSRTLMARLEADNAEVENSLFTIKHATECQSTGRRMVDRETHERAMLIVAGPMETDMKGLMTGCGDYVGGFVRASDDSDFDFYTVNGGDVARKLGCELAQ